MGALADFIANQSVYDNSDQSDGVGRSVKRYFDRLLEVQGDQAYPAAYAAINEVQSITQDLTDYTGGTFALTVTLRNGETFTTAAIVFNAAAGVIETAIDVAATALPVTGWTNGDISVSGGILQAAGAPVVLTFDGTSVAGDNHPLTVFDEALLTGGTEPATRVTVTNEGQTTRAVWAVMDMMNITNGVLPVQGTILPMTIVGERGNMHLQPNADVLIALASQASIDDISDAVEIAILDGLRANGVAV